MLKIGVFSRVSQVSIKMLRHYDDRGLLKPMYVDEWSSYRYYSLEQLPRLNRILALKDLGFSLEQIAQMLNTPMSSEQLRGMLRLRRAQMQQHIQEEQGRLARVETRLWQIEQEGTMSNYEVVLKKAEPMLVVGISETVPEGEQVTPAYYQIFEELFAYAAQQGIDSTGRQMSIDTSLDAGWKVNDTEVTIEAAIRVDRPYPETGRIKVHTLPAVESMACTVHRGDYDLLGQAYEAVLRWTEANGYEVEGTNRHLYLQTGNSGGENITEVQYLLTHA